MTPTRIQIIFAKEIVANVKLAALATVLVAIFAIFYYGLRKPDYYSEVEIEKFNKSCQAFINYVDLNPIVKSYIQKDLIQNFEVRYNRIKIPVQYLPLDYHQADNDWGGIYYSAESRKSDYFRRVNDMDRDYRNLDRSIKGAELINSDVESRFKSDLKEFMENFLVILVFGVIATRYLFFAVRWIYQTSKIQI